MRSVFTIGALLCAFTLASGQEIKRASDIIGTNVVIDRAVVGKVVDFAFGTDGTIEYLVITATDDRQQTVVPWGACGFRWGENRARTTIALNITVEQFTRTPRWRGNSWPNFKDDQFKQKLRTSYGEKAFRQTQSTPAKPNVKEDRDAPKKERPKDDKEPAQKERPKDDKEPAQKERPKETPQKGEKKE